LEAARKAIEQGVIGCQYWTRAGKYQTNSGDKICYTCRSFAKCPKRMYLLLDPESQDVHANVSTDEHDHTISTKVRLHPHSRQKVLDLIEAGVTAPRKLLKELERHNLPILTKVQISNLKRRAQTEVFSINTKSAYMYHFSFENILDFW
jgi:hypothetical protein